MQNAKILSFSRTAPKKGAKREVIPQQEKETRLITVNDAAERLSLTPDTIRKWLRSGQLKGVKVSRVWRVQESDIETIMKEGR